MVRQGLEGPLVPSMKPMIQDLLGELLSLQLQPKIARRVSTSNLVSPVFGMVWTCSTGLDGG